MILINLFETYPIIFLFQSNIINHTKSKLNTSTTFLEEVVKKVDGDIRENFEHVNSIIRDMDFATLRPIIQFSYNLNKTFFDENYELTPEQEMLYGLE